MRRVVIASPWRGDTELHLEYLKAALRDCYQRGESPIASHAIGPLALDDEDPVQREQGIEGGLAWIEVADVLAVYCDLGSSLGQDAEIEHARLVGVAIEYREIEGWEEGRKVG